MLCPPEGLSVDFVCSNFGLFFILLNVAMGIMLHCAPVSYLTPLNASVGLI